ncbi:unnamed protein product [Lepeophtheirus salmonis]|uniref:(salmon louse) hypothetical protein n=1 Tax=Lepeophtheirus salmonis TaxID=72036 RepID=A0A7R8HCX3_LEPSM|nr:unnamed protein product [Lepeophtheirus salmonis]CAF3011771.1 unnamed protein product [Lepeophtheirus salmonis]
MRLNTDEIIEILDRLDSNNDIIMGFPDVNDLSDGDSDKTDEEAIEDSDRLSRLLLQAPAHIEQDVDEMEENIPSNSKKTAFKFFVVTIDELHNFFYCDCSSRMPIFK